MSADQPAQNLLDGPLTVLALRRVADAARPGAYRTGLADAVRTALATSGRQFDLIEVGPGVKLAEAVDTTALHAAQNRGVLVAIGFTLPPERLLIERAAWRHDVAFTRLDRPLLDSDQGGVSPSEPLAPDPSLRQWVDDWRLATVMSWPVGIANQLPFVERLTAGLEDGAPGPHGSPEQPKALWRRLVGWRDSIEAAVRAPSRLRLDMIDARGWTRLLVCSGLAVTRGAQAQAGAEAGAPSLLASLHSRLGPAQSGPGALGVRTDTAARPAAARDGETRPAKTEAFEFRRVDLRPEQSRRPIVLVLDGESVALPSPVRIEIADRPLREIIVPSS